MGVRVDNPLIPPLTIDKKNNLKFLIMAKDSELCAVLREFNSLAAPSRKFTATSSFGGGAQIPVGTKKTVENVTCEVIVSKDGVKTPWLALNFTDGTKTSLRAFMGLPSLSGFSNEQIECDVYNGTILPNGEKATEKELVTPDCDINPEARYTPTTWCVNDFISSFFEKELKGRIVTYHGFMAKAYKVKNPIGNQVAGGVACIKQAVWTVDNLPADSTEA